MSLIRVEALTVRYGRRRALDGVSFEVPEGSVYALLGRNGAGKSSLVRCLLGTQRAAAGRAVLFDRDVWRARAAVLAEVGVVPEEPDAPQTMSALQLSRFCARLYPRWDEAGLRARLERFRVPADLAFGRLSKGQKAQVSLALALAPTPRLLILDDPTLGLDPVARRSVFDELIGELADRGTTVFLTSHDLAGVEGIADRAGILQDGRLLVDEEVESLKQRFRRISLPGAAEAPEARGAGTPRSRCPRLGGGSRGRRLGRGSVHGPAVRPRGPRRGLGPDARGDLPRPGGRRPPVRGFVAVVRREIAEYRLLFPAAFLIGLVALATPWLPGTRGHAPADLRGAAAFSLAAIVTLVLSVVLGSSVFARDLAERRLGFYFARPLPGWALWAGKLVAAVILALAAGILVLVPSVAAGGHMDLGGSWWLGGLLPGDVGELVPFLILGVLSLLLAAHTLSTMVRARSPWLLLDLLAALAVAAAFQACRGSLLSEGAVEAFNRGATLFFLAIFFSALLASAVQVIRGRTDLRRGHRLLSLTLWGCLGIASAAFAGYAGWVLRVEPEDLTQLDRIVPAPAGTWIGLAGGTSGRGRLYRPAFLFDAASGRFLRIRNAGYDYYWWHQPFFSADGRRAVWLDHHTHAVQSLDLARPGAEPVSLPVVYPDLPRYIVMSPGGTRIAALRDDRLTVDDLSAGRLLASVPTRFDYGDRAVFVDEQRLRIYRTSRDPASALSGRRHLEILELDVDARRLRTLGRLAYGGGLWSMSPDGEHILLRENHKEARLVDVGTGRTLTSIAAEPLLVAEDFLADGRIVLVSRDPSRQRTTLTVLDRDGTERSRAVFAASRLLLGGQPLPGSLVVATSRVRGSYTSQRWTSWLVDLATGRVRTLGQGLVPVTVRPIGPQSIASRLFATGHGGLVLLDPVTGRRRTVLEPGSPDLGSPDTP